MSSALPFQVHRLLVCVQWNQFCNGFITPVGFCSHQGESMKSECYLDNVVASLPHDVQEQVFEVAAWSFPLRVKCFSLADTLVKLL